MTVRLTIDIPAATVAEIMNGRPMRLVLADGTEHDVEPVAIGRPEDMNTAAGVARAVAQHTGMSRYEASLGIRPPRKSGKVRGVAYERDLDGGTEIWHCDHDHAPGVHDCRKLSPAQVTEAQSCAESWLRGQVAARALVPMPVVREPS